MGGIQCLEEIVREGLHQLAAKIRYNNEHNERERAPQTSISRNNNEMLERLKLTIGSVHRFIHFLHYIKLILKPL